MPTNTRAVSDETPLWRYTDLTKFVAMLASNALWFSKMAQFEDAWEGFCQAWPREMPENDPYDKCIGRTIGEGETEYVSVTQMFSEISEEAAAYFEHAREHLYVNSWCLAAESMAMWEIYGAAGRGIAVKSSVGQYQKAMQSNVRQEQHAFGCVQYDGDPLSNPKLKKDFRQGPVPAAGPGVWEKLLPMAFHKRACFEHEKEWRAALFQDVRPELGCTIDFDLNELITAVYVGPRADELFREVVKGGNGKVRTQKAFGAVSTVACSSESGHCARVLIVK